LGDEGSGYWISLQAMRAVLQAHDGRIASTHLTSAVLNHFGMSDVLDLVFQATQGMVKPIGQSQFGVAPDSGSSDRRGETPVGGLHFRKFSTQRTLSRDEIASLCPVVVRSAQQGDWRALEILSDAGKELGHLGRAVIKRLRMEADEFVVVPFGGVFRAGRLVLDPFEKTILSVAGRANVVVPRFEPVVGAVMLAMDDLEVDLTPGVLETLDRTSNDFPVCRIIQMGA
jgi:N-acetylglucosamine kinase-like BadF-type ATPase